MKCIAYPAVVFLVATQLGLATAQADSVDAILTRYVTALGGKPALEKITSHSFKGKLQVSGVADSSDWEFCSKAPNRQWSHTEIPGVGEITDGFDGTVAWSKSAFGGLRVKSGDELAKVKRDSDFYRDLKLKTLYPGLALKGTDKVDEEPAQILEAKPTPASVERFWFSTRSGLLVKQESEFQGPDGKVKIMMRLTDYRPVETIQYPHLFKCSLEAGGQTFDFSIKFNEMRHNVPIEDARFAKPAS